MNSRSCKGSSGTLRSQAPRGRNYPTGTRSPLPDCSGRPGHKASTLGWSGAPWVGCPVTVARPPFAQSLHEQSPVGPNETGSSALTSKVKKFVELPVRPRRLRVSESESDHEDSQPGDHSQVLTIPKTYDLVARQPLAAFGSARDSETGMRGGGPGSHFGPWNGLYRDPGSLRINTPHSKPEAGYTRS